VNVPLHWIFFGSFKQWVEMSELNEWNLMEFGFLAIVAFGLLSCGQAIFFNYTTENKT